MMVFSGLLKTSSDTQRHRRGSSSGSPRPEKTSLPNKDASSNLDALPFISHESQLDSPASEAPELRELNNCLGALAAIFPDVQLEVFREMLSSFDEESRLAVVTEALIKNKMKWVGGRYKVVSKDVVQKKEDTSKAVGLVPKEEKFRDPAYKQAVKLAAYHEFKGLSHSTIKAVLAEHNHSYTRARPTLMALHSKSWRFSISIIFTRKKPSTSLEADHHPLVVWHSTGFGSIMPTLKCTGCAELDKELFESLIKPLQKRNSTERFESDHKVALELNTQEAEETGSLHDCECCYSLTAFEQLSACNAEGHFICFQCVRHAINEAVFGQGWSRNIDVSTGTLRCLAPVTDECHGCIPQDLIRRALLEEKGGEDILRKLDERLAEDGLLKANLPLIHCPFCSYAEIDELYLPENLKSWRFRHQGPFSLFSFAFLLSCFAMIPVILPVFIILSLAFLLVFSHQTFYSYITHHISASIIRMRRHRHGLRFTCQNPACTRLSCISCSKAWTDIHVCHESSLLALRTQVELAMSLAIKRTCPRCNTSFVKSSGCNKLTCVCGYQMCYVCRKDIGNGEGYRHFCEHFRPNGGRGCTECDKCDLYRCEDDEVVVRKAKEEAERAWLEKEGEGVDGKEVKKNLVEQYDPKRGQNWWLTKIWREMDWERALDAVVEFVVE
jgi:hypothetical protein